MKTYKDLKTEYNKAVKENAAQFEIDGHDFLVSYAKYLIEFLDMHKTPDKKALSNIFSNW